MSGWQAHSYRGPWPLLVILVLSAGLRAWQIGESLWLDELHTAWVVSGGIGDIAERARLGNQSPVYFFLPWLTTSLFGMSEWGLRMPSLLAGLALVAAVYAIILKFTCSMPAAVMAAMLAGIDHNCLFYATEARSYAVVQLTAAIQLMLFWRLQARADLNIRVAFVSTTCLLFYLHYTAILVVIGELIAQGIWAWLASALNRSPKTRASDATRPQARHSHPGRGTARQLSRWAREPRTLRTTRPYAFTSLLCDLLIVAALTVPASFHLWEIASRRDNWQTFIRDTNLLSAARWFSLVSYVAVAGLAAAVSTFLGRDESPARQGPARPAFALLVTCWFAGPVVLAWLVTSAGLVSLYFPRYLMALAIAPILLGGLCVGCGARQRWRFGAAIVVVAAATYASSTSAQLYHFGRVLGDRREDWMSAVDWLNSNYDTTADNAPPVFVRSGLLEANSLRSETTPLFKQYCLCPINSIYPFRNQDALVPLPTRRPGALSSASITRIKDAGTAWFVINAPASSHDPIRQQVFATLRAAGVEVTPPPSYAFGNVRVWRLEAK